MQVSRTSRGEGDQLARGNGKQQEEQSKQGKQGGAEESTGKRQWETARGAKSEKQRGAGNQLGKGVGRNSKRSKVSRGSRGEWRINWRRGFVETARGGNGK
jgi:hypothetical protein